jgi:hypothetical protein
MDSKKETFICDRCNKEFSTKESVRRHQRRSKICKVIQKKLPKQSTLKEQMSKLGMILIEK